MKNQIFIKAVLFCSLLVLVVPPVQGAARSSSSRRGGWGLYGDKLYVCSANRGVISCYNAKTEKAYFFKERLEKINEIYASPAGAAGRVYFVGRNGVTYVLRCAEQFEVLAVNKLDDGLDCSPAFVGNEMYLKGKQNLYCIASSDQ